MPFPARTTMLRSDVPAKQELTIRPVACLCHCAGTDFNIG